MKHFGKLEEKKKEKLESGMIPTLQDEYTPRTKRTVKTLGRGMFSRRSFSNAKNNRSQSFGDLAGDVNSSEDENNKCIEIFNYNF